MTTQNTQTHGTLPIPPSAKRKAAATTAPAAIHGRRLPSVPRVRSLSAPTSGCANRVKPKETEVTMARFCTLFAGSTCAIWLGSSTAMIAAKFAASTSATTDREGRSARPPLAVRRGRGCERVGAPLIAGHLALRGDEQRFLSRTHPELAVDAAHLALDRIRGDEEPFGDLGNVSRGNQMREDHALALCQGGVRERRGQDIRDVVEPVEDAVRECDTAVVSAALQGLEVCARD